MERVLSPKSADAVTKTTMFMLESPEKSCSFWERWKVPWFLWPYHRFQKENFKKKACQHQMLQVGFPLHQPYIQLIHKNTGEYLHFRYLKCLVIPTPKHVFNLSIPPQLLALSSPGTVMRCAMSGSPKNCELGISCQRFPPTWFKGEATVRNAGYRRTLPTK